MSNSPFLAQGPGSRRSRAAAKRRRRRIRRLGFAALVIVLTAAFALGKGLLVLGRGATHTLTLSGEQETLPSGQAPLGKRAHGPRTAGTTTLLGTGASISRIGLPLGKPPLALKPPQGHNALTVAFHHEPRAGVLFDLDTGQVLWSREATRVLPIASLAKMMTALLVVRARPPEEPVLITRGAVNASGSKVGLLPLHKHVPLETLLYGLLLPSGNDAAVALAENVAGSIAHFVSRMNIEAARLGMGCTRYTSPDGLDNGNSSCAADLAELAHVDLEQPRLAAITRSASAVQPFPIKGHKLYLYNNNPLLRYSYPGATGLKTGETEAAGLCLVGTAERHGVRLGVVLLHSPELGRQAEYLLDRGFADVYGQAPIPAPPVPVGR
jgi:serine-type D-Ala-D-Ala carboxypeptidase (penicillin-binding protein 5/6)